MLKVVAVIPTYNGGESLINLVAQLTLENFYKIYVIDDATARNTRIKFSNPKVTAIYGNKNLGPVGNRNRILSHDMGDIILFCDDDMSVITKNIPEIIDDFYSHDKKLGVLGTQILDERGTPLTFNFDRESNPLFRSVEMVVARQPLKPDQRKFDKRPMEVCWVLEGLSAVRSDLFVKLHGFDDGFKRYCEGPDLCRRVRGAGYKVCLTNAIRASHLRPLAVISNRRGLVFVYLRSSLRWYRKYNPLSDRLRAVI